MHQGTSNQDAYGKAIVDANLSVPKVAIYHPTPLHPPPSLFPRQIAYYPPEYLDNCDRLQEGITSNAIWFDRLVYYYTFVPQQDVDKSVSARGSPPTQHGAATEGERQCPGVLFIVIDERAKRGITLPVQDEIYNTTTSGIVLPSSLEDTA